MWLRRVRGRPVTHPAWGSIVAWVDDMFIDPLTARVVAYDLRLTIDTQRHACVAPFALESNPLHSHLAAADPDRWQPLERESHWIGLQALARLLVVWDDGDRSMLVEDADWDPETGLIRAYKVRRHWWQLGGIRSLSPEVVIAGGPDLLLVRKPDGRQPQRAPEPSSSAHRHPPDAVRVVSPRRLREGVRLARRSRRRGARVIPFRSTAHNEEDRMLLTQLAGRTVIDSAVARHVGTVSDAVVDPVNGRLVALFMDANHTDKPSAVRADGIVGIGPYAVMLRGGSQPEVHDDVREDGLLDSAAIFGLEVVAEDGTYIGQVRDVQIDPATLQIERYLVNRSGWMRWPRRTRIGGTRVVSCSPELMVVARAAPTERRPEAKPRVADLAQTVSLSTGEPGDG